MDTPPNPEATAAAARKRRLDLRWNKVTNSKGDVYSRKVVDGTAGLPPKPDTAAGEAQGRTPPGLQHWGSGGFLEGTSGAPFLVASTLSRSSSEDAARDLFFRSNSSSSANSAAPAPSAVQDFTAVALRAKFRRPQFRRLKEDQKAGKGPSADTDKPELSSGADEDATSDDISSETSSSGTSTSSDEDAMDAVVTAAASLLREEMTQSSVSDAKALGSGSFAPPAAGALSLTAGGDSASAAQGAGSTTGAVFNTVPSQCVAPPWVPGLPGDHCPSNGVLSVCGRRREMEDAVSMVPAFATVPCCSTVGCVGVHQALTGGTTTMPGHASEGKCQLHLFAVYDGHGGSQAANFCALHLAQTLEEELSLSVKASEAAKAAAGEAWSPPSSLSVMESQWKQAFTASFARVDAEVSGHCYERRSRCNMSGECGHQPLAEETVGTTSVVSVLTQRHIIVGNCGDSRAVLSRGGQAFALSKDHKPDREDEMKRIEAAGGRVVFWNGYRVLGVLAMSRAIGDRYLKPYVIPEPEVTFTERSDDDECLILASDGLWDVINDETACDLARKCLTTTKPEEVDAAAMAGGVNASLAGAIPGKDERPASLAAAVLTRLALARGSSDNTSVVVVDLRKQQNTV